MGAIANLDQREIDELIRTSLIGRIACCDHSGEGRPYLVPISYGYDGDSIYAHSRFGRKIKLMRANPLVTFEVDSGHASDSWRSAIAEGTFEEISGDAERGRALNAIYPDGGAPDLDSDLIVFKIVLGSRSGRTERPG